MADGSVTIEVELDRADFEKGITSMKGKLNSLSSSGITTNSVIDGLSKGLKTVGNAMTSVGKISTGISAGIVAGLGSAVSRFDTLNNYPKVLSNLGFSADDAKRSIDMLSKGIDGLPTSLDSAASGVQRLVAKNSDIDKSTKYFLAMNDAIVAGNAPAELQASAIEQLTQSYSKGKPDLMEWRTLMQAMPGPLRQVATAMGYVDTDELYDALQKGSISMDDFMNKLVEMDETSVDGFTSFSEQVHNSCDSVGTAITNVKNRFVKGFAEILKSMNEVATNTKFGSLAGIINSFSSSLGTFLTKIGDSLKNNEAFNSLMNSMVLSVSRFNDTLTNLNDEQINNITTALVKLVEIGPGLIAGGKALSMFGDTLGKINGITNAFEKSTETFAGIGTNLIKPFQGIGKNLISLATPLQSFALKFSTLGQLMKYNITESISSLPDSISNLAGKFSNSFSNILGSIGKFAPAFLSGFGKAFAIAPVIGLVVGGLGLLNTQFGVQINDILTTVTTQGPQIITNFVNGILSQLPTLIESGGQLVNSFLNAVIANLPALITGGIDIVASLITGIAQQLPQLIPTAITLIMTIFNSLIQNLPTIIEAGIQLLLGLITGIVNALPQLIAMTPRIIVSIVTTLIRCLPQISSAGVQIIVILMNGIASMFGSLDSCAKNIINIIGDKLKGNSLFEWGRDMILGFINGIKSMLGSVGDVAGSVANKVKEFLHFSKPDRGPLREYEKWMPDMIKGLTSSMQKASPELYNASKELAQKISDNLDLSEAYNKLANSVGIETQKLNANLTATSTADKTLNANITLKSSDIYMDSKKVGRAVTPIVSKNLKGAGAY